MYYLYRHVRLDNNTVFYIGIGKKPNKIFPCREYKRAYEAYKRNKFWKNIVNKTSYKVDILFESESREEIINKEKEFILLYGRRDINTGTLVNHTSGGDGQHEWNPPKSHREASRKRMIEMNKTLKRKNHTSILVLNIETGIFYNTLRDAYNFSGITCSESHFKKLVFNNKINFRLCV